MMWVNFFFVLSCVLAVVHAGLIPEEKFFGEGPLEEIPHPHHRNAFEFDLRSLAAPDFEPPFELPPLPLEISRTNYRLSNSQRSSNRGSGRNRSNNRSPTETNELSSGDEDLKSLLFADENNDKRAAFLRDQQRLEDFRNFFNIGEIRKRRDVAPVQSAEGEVRQKRSHCKKCGGGGYGGGYVQPTYVQPAYVQPTYVQKPIYTQPTYIQKPVYTQPAYVQKPVYVQPSYGGGGGCHTCGGGGYGHPGFSGSFSQSSSQSSSSSGSFGYGKK